MISKISPAFMGHVNINQASKNAVINAYAHHGAQVGALEANIDYFVKTVEDNTPENETYELNFNTSWPNSPVYMALKRNKGERAERTFGRAVAMYDKGQYTTGEDMYKKSFRPFAYIVTHDSDDRVQVRYDKNSSASIEFNNGHHIIEKIAEGIKSELDDDNRFLIEARTDEEKCSWHETEYLKLAITDRKDNNWQPLGYYSYPINEWRFVDELEDPYSTSGWRKCERTKEEEKEFINSTIADVIKKSGEQKAKTPESIKNAQGHWFDINAFHREGKISYSDNNDLVIGYWKRNKDQYLALTGNIQSLAQKLNDETPYNDRYRISLLDVIDNNDEKYGSTRYVAAAVQNVNTGDMVEQMIPMHRGSQFVSGQDIWEEGFKPLCEKLGLSH